MGPVQTISDECSHGGGWEEVAVRTREVTYEFLCYKSVPFSSTRFLATAGRSYMFYLTPGIPAPFSLFLVVTAVIHPFAPYNYTKLNGIIFFQKGVFMILFTLYTFIIEHV